MQTDYRLDTHYGSGSVSHTVGTDRLTVTFEKKRQTVEIPFENITEINLRRDRPGVYSVRIAHKGGPTIIVPSRHFVAFGRFEDRSAEYAGFLATLHAAARARSPRVRFVGGSSLFYWLGVVIGLALVSMFTLVVYGVFVQGHPLPPLRIFWIVPGAIAVAGGFLTQGRAKPYDPRILPPKFLPVARGRAG